MLLIIRGVLVADTPHAKEKRNMLGATIVANSLTTIEVVFN